MTGFVLGQRPAHRSINAAIENWAPEEVAALAGSSPCTVWLYRPGEVWPIGERTTTAEQYLRSTVDGDISAIAPDAAPGTMAYGYLAGELMPALHDRIETAAAAAGRRWTPDQPARIYAGPAGSCSGLHWDGRSAVLVHLHGQKEAALFAPSATPHLDPFPAADGPNAGLDPFAGDPGPLPPHLRLVIEAGSVLNIPYRWWHSIRSLTPTVSITFW